MSTPSQTKKSGPALAVSAAVLLGCAVLPSTALAMASAELYSTEAHFYGRFEARIRYAPGDGVVSSFFLWKEGSNGTSVYWNELDFEKVGANCEMHTNAYYGMPAAQHTQTNAMPGDICADYHTYALEWAPTYISWSVDGKEFRRETGATATAFAQNATAGMTIHFNVWPGNSSFGGNISKTTLPVHEYISWVQYSSYDNGTFKLQSRQEFDGSGIPAGWAVGNWSSPFNLSTHNPQNVSFVNGIAVMSLTNDNATGNPGTPPADSQAAGGASGSGGSAAGGTSGTGAGGASGGASGSGGSSSAGGNTGAGGTTTSGSGGAATNGGNTGNGGSQNAGGALSQGGATTASTGGTPGANGGSNAAGGSNSSSSAGGSGGGSTTTTVDSAGGSAAGGNSSKTGGSSGCNMTGAGHGTGTATLVLLLGILGFGAFRRARRQELRVSTVDKALGRQ